MNPVTVFCLWIDCSARVLVNMARISNNVRDVAVNLQASGDKAMTAFTSKLPIEFKSLWSDAGTAPNAFIRLWSDPPPKMADLIPSKKAVHSKK